MTLEQARQVLLSALAARGVGGEGGVALIPGTAVRKAYGWVLLYNSREFVETSDILTMLVGQGPVVVFDTGELVELGSQLDADAAIEAFELSRGLKG